MSSTSSTYARSIFAYELECVTERHNYRLADFTRVPIAFDRYKVNALVKSLQSVERLPALNHEEILSLVYTLKLDRDERNRIYAALIALGVQRLMLSYLTDSIASLRKDVSDGDCERAWMIAEETRDMVLEWLNRKNNIYEPFLDNERQTASSTWDLYARSIFSVELEAILMQHALHLSDLKRLPLAYKSEKVDALVKSLQSVERLPALNHEEILSLVYTLKLDRDERNRIYAALIALGTQRLMLAYVTDKRSPDRVSVSNSDCERAWVVAEKVRDAALHWLISQWDRSDAIFR